jgi:hypothetical protein
MMMLLWGFVLSTMLGIGCCLLIYDVECALYFSNGGHVTKKKGKQSVSNCKYSSIKKTKHQTIEPNKS